MISKRKTHAKPPLASGKMPSTPLELPHPPQRTGGHNQPLARLALIAKANRLRLVNQALQMERSTLDPGYLPTPDHDRLDTWCFLLQRSIANYGPIVTYEELEDYRLAWIKDEPLEDITMDYLRTKQ